MDYILTNNGAAMMTQVAAGKTLLFTRTESGSGYSASPAVLQSVIDKKQDMFLDEVIYENKQAVVKSVLSNMQLEEEYQLRQVGVYAKLEGDETDTLLLIGQQYNGEKIPPYHDGIMQIEYNIAIKASGTGNITIEGVGTGYVTKGQFLSHLNDHSNPHKVTAKDVNLDKVPNVGTDDQTPTFEEAKERGNIVSGERVSVILGKIKKWLSDMKAAAFCSVANNLVTTLAGSVLDARQGKELQDQITGLYSDLGGFNPIVDETTGKITGYKTTIGGADTVFPFSEIDKNALLEALSASGLNITADSTPEEIYDKLSAAIFIPQGQIWPDSLANEYSWSVSFSFGGERWGWSSNYGDTYTQTVTFTLKKDGSLYSRSSISYSGDNFYTNYISSYSKAIESLPSVLKSYPLKGSFSKGLSVSGYKSSGSGTLSINFANKLCTISESFYSSRSDGDRPTISSWNTSFVWPQTYMGRVTLST